jgi:hypothetical protein
MLPQKPNPIFIAQLFQKITTLGSIHASIKPEYMEQYL